jgi:flagellar hook-length control protein FliK
MTVGLHSNEFGNIGIHTSLGHDQLAAQITVERGDLGKVLSEHMPALQERLSKEHGVNTEINIQDRSTGFSGSLDQGSREQQQPSSQSASVKTLFGETDEGPVQSATASMAALAAETDTMLDIRV